ARPGRGALDRAGHRGAAAGRGGCALPRPPPHGAQGVARGRVGRHRPQPSREVLPPHPARPPPARRRALALVALHRGRGARDRRPERSPVTTPDDDRRWRRAFHLAHRGRVRRDVDDELRFHIEGRIEEFAAAGMTRDEAEAEARRRFGDWNEYERQARHIDEDIMRDRSRLELFAALRRESRRAVRALIRTPAFTLIAVVTLALGIA